MARDVGGFFERMVKQAKGGRRLEADERDDPERDATPDVDPGASPASQRSGGGGVADRLKDILARGRATATTTGRSAADRARERVDRRKAPKRSGTLRPGPTPKSDLPSEGVVTVEYTPRIDGDPDPGEVVWTWVPFEEDPEQGKDRPVVVIGRRNDSLVGVPLTSRKNDREAQISIGTGDWDPKRRASYARIWRMLDIDEHATRREGAVLQRDRFEDVVAAVDRYYDIHRPQAIGDDDV